MRTCQLASEIEQHAHFGTINFKQLQIESKLKFYTIQ